MRNRLIISLGFAAFILQVIATAMFFTNDTGTGKNMVLTGGALGFALLLIVLTGNTNNSKKARSGS